MKKLTILLLSLLILTGCPNTDDPTEKVNVKINVVGLEFPSDNPDSLKSAPVDVFSDYKHTYAHTELNFFRDGANYSFQTGSIGQGITTSFSVGTYNFYGWSGSARPTGSSEMSFYLPEHKVVVNSGTTSIDLEADADCSLILVADIHNQIESAFISGPNYPVNAFTHNGIYYFTYVRPESNYQAHIIKKDSSVLTIDTRDLTTGRTYKVEVTAD
ncbi:MAG: hypothetical protein ABFS38_05695 [Bacteroidota bacterium]